MLRVAAISLFSITFALAQSPPCSPLHASAVAWWKADSNLLDSIGANHGTGNPNFVAGQTGQAFGFNGVNQQIVIPNSPSLNPTDLTLECWVNPLSPTADVVSILTKESDIGTVQYQIAQISINGRNAFRCLIGCSPGLIYASTQTPIQLGKWYHVAMTYDGKDLRLYLNGFLEEVSSYTAPVRKGQQPLYVGAERGGWAFNGLIDDIALYSQALSAESIETIHIAGSAGKCQGPVIVSHPKSQVGFWGKDVTFSVAADGDAPLSYYWQKDGFDLPGAYSSTLTLTNLQMTDAGQYSVLVSNVNGVSLSKAATLTMNPAGVSSALYTGLTIEGVVGFTYGVQASTNLSDPLAWRGVANVMLSTPRQLWLDFEPAIKSSRFYRVVPGPIPISQ